MCSAGLVRDVMFIAVETQSSSLSDSASFFLLSGLLCKSQLAGPWRIGGLTQESKFRPTLPIDDKNVVSMFGLLASHRSLPVKGANKPLQKCRRSEARERNKKNEAKMAGV